MGRSSADADAGATSMALSAKLPVCHCLPVLARIDVKDDPLSVAFQMKSVSGRRLSELIKADSPPPTTPKSSVPSCQLLACCLADVHIQRSHSPVK